MKLPDIKEFINLWPKSLAVLQTRVLGFFERNNIPTDNVWFPDIDIVFPKSLNHQKKIQVVFFGGFPERIFESGNWPDKEFTFWCLSSQVQKILTKIFKFNDDVIHVIPRYELFSKGTEKAIDLHSDLQVVYSGRLSSQKNIEMFLAFASILQESLTVNVEILLMGEWDNHGPKHRGRYAINSYKEIVGAFNQSLNFKTPPVYLNDLDHDEWMGQLKSNCLMVNFSTFICEDYGVSVAQAQEAGIPMILSKWGGHCDVEASNVLWVDTHEIAESLSEKEVIILKAQNLVGKFLTNQLLKTEKNNYLDASTSAYIQLDDLYKIRKDLMSRYGQEMMLLGQDRLSLFASTDPGKSFFNHYSYFFSGKMI